MNLDTDRVLGDEISDGPSEGLSLRDELAAALSADGASDGPSGVSSPVPEAAAANPEPAPADGRVRDEHGRFAPKAEGQAQSTELKSPQGVVAPAEGQVAQPQASGPPPSWSAAAKAQWDGLPDAIRQEVARHEATVQDAKAQWQQKGEQLNRLTAAIGPRAEQWRLNGFSPEQGVQRLIAAEEFLDRDPVNGIAHLARQYGVNLQQLLAATGQQGQAPQVPAPFQQLAHEVQTLKQTLTQQQQAAEQARYQGAVDQITAFRADPANKYYENVRERMGVLLQTGQATSLADAYEQATWSDPQVRAARLQEQAAGQAKLSGDRAKVAQAKHASGSVTGSPTPGSSPARAVTNPNATIGQDLREVWDQLVA